MAQPRFLFVSRARSHPESWAPRRAHAVAHESIGFRDSAWVAWRLVGANNRELGRSGETFADITDCRAAIARTCAQLTSCPPGMMADPSTGSWYWRLDVGPETLAVSGRAYQRQRECSYSFGQFLIAAPGAARALRSLVDVASTTCSSEGTSGDHLVGRPEIRLPNPRAGAQLARPALTVRNFR